MGGGFGGMGGFAPHGLQTGAKSKPISVKKFADKVQAQSGQGATTRFTYAQQALDQLAPMSDAEYAKATADGKAYYMAQQRWNAYNAANISLKKGDRGEV
jgi:hypothetical protein